ncbi:MAG: hypothetical protein Q7V36_01595, partial [Deltaproteobacteria bacterium]|nr:hypothetical protein [Deltaproteobacteria bacterium]
ANRTMTNQISPTLISPTLNARTYDDFVVPDSGWTINTLYSNNFVYNSTITEAYWEIRQGVVGFNNETAGDVGTLIISGTSSATVTPTGRYSPDDFLQTYPEQTVAVDVTGQNLFLSDGTYWLSVTPIVLDANGWVANTVTTGENGTGFNFGKGFACYIDANTNQQYADGNYLFDGPIDYSMGIDGTTGGQVPIPPSILLLASGLLALSVHGFRARKR